jgi:hypothetical protein
LGSGRAVHLRKVFHLILLSLHFAKSPTHVDGNIVISWPSSAGGFTLQQNSNLAALSSWATSGYAISTNGATESITISPPTGKLFFRLVQP